MVFFLSMRWISDIETLEIVQYQKITFLDTFSNMDHFLFVQARMKVIFRRIMFQKYEKFMLLSMRFLVIPMKREGKYILLKNFINIIMKKNFQKAQKNL